MVIIQMFRRHVRRFRLAVFTAFIAILFQVGLALLTPWPIKIVFDSVLLKNKISPWLSHILHILTQGRSDNKIGLLSTMVIGMIIIALITALFTYIGSFLTAYVGQKIVFQIRLEAFDHVQRLSLQFHRDNKVGDLSARLTSDIQAIQDIVSSGLNSLITSAMTVVGIIIIVAIIDWHFAILMVCTTPLLMMISNSYRKRMRNVSRIIRSVEGQVGAHVQEKLSAIQTVQGFANEAVESQVFAARSQHSLRAGLILSQLQSEMTPLVDLVGAIAVAIIVWIGAREVLFNTITPGYLFLFVTYFRSTLAPIRQLSKLTGRFSKAEASAERLAILFNEPVEVADLPNARPAPRLNGSIVFDRVSFSYANTHGNEANSAPIILQNISYGIQSGTFVGIIGMTGSGKSTLLSLIPRFYDATSGKVMIDGRDLRSYTLRSLRDQISMVLQEPVLFQGTIRDNIAYGRPQASDQEIIQAAKQANAHEFVAKLPLGYGTIISERGSTLSGGQRQRIAIARAMLRNAPILLLDEPTTGLDASSEVEVMDAIYRLAQGRTTLMIAHRLQTVERADLIIVMKQGMIIESGTHEELRQQGGQYSQWLRLQHMSV